MEEIKDVLNSDGIVPSFIDATPLVVKRLDQISDLVDVGFNIPDCSRDYFR